MEELWITIVWKSQAYNTMVKLLIINNQPHRQINNQPRFQLYNLSQIFVDFSFDIFQLSTRWQHSVAGICVETPNQNHGWS